jgi:acyl-CoA reductase-like NAD-dependent aldehyde dehydrogenase
VFGLGAAVFTQDVAKGEHIAAGTEAGCCFVNAYENRNAEKALLLSIKMEG